MGDRIFDVSEIDVRGRLEAGYNEQPPAGDPAGTDLVFKMNADPNFVRLAKSRQQKQISKAQWGHQGEYKDGNQNSTIQVATFMNNPDADGGFNPEVDALLQIGGMAAVNDPGVDHEWNPVQKDHKSMAFFTHWRGEDHIIRGARSSTVISGEVDSPLIITSSVMGLPGLRPNANTDFPAILADDDCIDTLSADNLALSIDGYSGLDIVSFNIEFGTIAHHNTSRQNQIRHTGRQVVMKAVVSQPELADFDYRAYEDDACAKFVSEIRAFGYKFRMPKSSMAITSPGDREGASTTELTLFGQITTGNDDFIINSTAAFEAFA